jgi:hypothetical protein
VDEFGPNCRREGPEASLEPRLHLIEVHDVEANLRADGAVVALSYR